MSKLPNIKSFLNVTQYLQEIYRFKREHSKEFSYQTWAQELKISKSYLQFLVAGQRNISAKLSFMLVKNLELSGLEAEYFYALISYCQSAEGELKLSASRQLMQVLRQSTDLTEISTSEALLSNPLNMTIRNILSFTDVDHSISKLAEMLAITEEKVEHILIRLQSVGLVSCDEGQWKATHENVSIREKLGDELLINYHKQILMRATEIDDLPVHLRYFRSVGLALNEEQYKEYLKDVNDFVMKTFAKFSGEGLQSKRMYQLNFNAFPWTKEEIP